MKTYRHILIFVLTLVATAVLTAPAGATGASDDGSAAFHALLEPYEGARAALAKDRLGTAREHGSDLQRALDQLAELTPESAGVSAEELPAVRALLPELETAAGELAMASDLEAARDAFYALTKPLVRWRQAAGEGPKVAYCPMKKRSWLQPGDEIGNPYSGAEMSSCGEVVDG